MELNCVGYLLVAFIFNFYPAIFLGYVVDDNAIFPASQKHKKVILDKEISVKQKLNSLRHLLYGAGLFKNPRLDHALNLLIHLANCLLIYKIVGGNVGFIASILYMLNPVNNQTTLWLNGRRYALATLAVLLCWAFPISALVLFPIAAWLHVSVALFPILFLFTPERWMVAFLIVGGLLLGWRLHQGTWKARVAEFLNPPGGVNEAQKIRPGKLVIYIKSVGVFFTHGLLPEKPRMYHEFLYYFGRYESEIKEGYSLNKDFFIGLVALGYLLYEIIIGHNLYAGWFLLLISQYCGIYTVTMNVADRYLALSGVGLMILLSQKIALLPSNIGLAVTVGFLVFYVLKYRPLFDAYKGYRAFCWYHIGIEPSGVEGRTVLALQYFNQPKPDPMSAYAVLKEGLKKRPNDFKLQVMMAQSLFMLGRIEHGLKVLDIAEANIPLGDEKDCKVEFAKMRESILKTQKEEQNEIQKVKGLNSHLAGIGK